VIAEVALALVLLISAGLLIKSSVQLQRVDLGFDPRGVMSARLELPEHRYPDSTRVIPFLEQLVGRLGGLPGVTAAAATTGLPMNSGTATDYAIEGRPPVEKGREPIVQFRAITPDYLDLMRIPVRSGRAITGEDRLTSRPVALINQSMAQQEWPDGDPLGQRIILSSGTYEVVGVVADAREFGPDDEAPTTMFVAEYQRGFRGVSLVVRSTGDPAALAPAIRQTVQSLDAGLPAYQVQTLEEMVANEGRGDRVMTKLLAIFGGLALVLAMLGVYGVMSYVVAQRTREVGIRMALGAEAGDIVRLVLRQGSQMTLLGLAIGLLIAFGVTRTLAAFLYGVSTFDLMIFGGVTAALLAAALIAIVIPARRATRVDPLVALRD
jgi:predicted permease